jgi:hypothetical protein
MPTVTLKEARKRTGLDLVSDRDLPIWDELRGSGSVRNSQRDMERRYPRHREIRTNAMQYFLNEGFELYPRGITVNGTGTCPDFAIFRGKKIKFIECLTESWVNAEMIKRKSQVEPFAPIAFVIEDKPKEEFQTPKDRLDYQRRIKILSKRATFYLYNPLTKRIHRYQTRDYGKD